MEGELKKGTYFLIWNFFF